MRNRSLSCSSSRDKVGDDMEVARLLYIRLLHTFRKVSLLLHLFEDQQAILKVKNASIREKKLLQEHIELINSDGPELALNHARRYEQ
jgi:hypothetical protein